MDTSDVPPSLTPGPPSHYHHYHHHPNRDTHFIESDASPAPEVYNTTLYGPTPSPQPPISPLSPAASIAPGRAPARPVSAVSPFAVDDSAAAPMPALGGDAVKPRARDDRPWIERVPEGWVVGGVVFLGITFVILVVLGATGNLNPHRGGGGDGAAPTGLSYVALGVSCFRRVAPVQNNRNNLLTCTHFSVQLLPQRYLAIDRRRVHAVSVGSHHHHDPHLGLVCAHGLRRPRPAARHRGTSRSNQPTHQLTLLPHSVPPRPPSTPTSPT